MSIMRIAIAGTGGLARHIGHFIHDDSSHQIVFLSRTEQPQLSARGWQVLVVDYTNPRALKYALLGVDTVISTVTGPNQLELIKAAVLARVRRFAPAEFEGPPDLRGADDQLDRGGNLARQLLASYSDHIHSTTFVCGILYERFQPGGLKASGIGFLSRFCEEGVYMIDPRNVSAEAPVYDENGSPSITICLTALQDIARFVAKAIELPDWPEEIRIQGHRTTVRDLLMQIQQLKGQQFDPLQAHSRSSLQAAIELATVQRNFDRFVKLQTLLATAEGRYDFVQSDWNRLLPQEQMKLFFEWYARVWNL